MTKFDPVGSLTTSPAIDLRHAEALFGLLAPLLRQLIDVAVAAALQQYCDEQRSNEPDVLNLTQFCKRNNMGKTYFYQLVKDGLAPEFMLYGKEYRITIAAETAWRAKKHERAKSEEVQLGSVPAARRLIRNWARKPRRARNMCVGGQQRGGGKGRAHDRSRTN